nr:prolyl aminopeptidase [uncultured Hyphomonas sp.]
MTITASEKLYPPIEPYQTGWLDVGDGHNLYWEESGNPDGVPVVYLHGGPGGALGPAVRQFYDPEFYRIVYFHQRGAGRSTPLGETRANTTAHLISDIERLRQALDVPAWVVAGGSWGSTLALAYAEAHPHACLALLVNGVFLGRPRDIAWFFEGARDFHPRAWKAFLEFLPEPERADYFAAYARRILNDDPAVYGPAVKAWSAYEGTIATLVPDPSVFDSFQDDTFALAYARMNIHYFGNNCFLDETPILDRIGRLSGIPGLIVHGRYDMATAYRSAVELVDVWEEAELITVPDAGHSRFDPPNTLALLAAQERLKALLGAREAR